MPFWLKAILLVLVVTVIFYMVFVVNELGSVHVPRVERLKPENLTRLDAKQGWPRGWGFAQAQWFHHTGAWPYSTVTPPRPLRGCLR